MINLQIWGTFHAQLDLQGETPHGAKAQAPRAHARVGEQRNDAARDEAIPEDHEAIRPGRIWWIMGLHLVRGNE